MNDASYSLTQQAVDYIRQRMVTGELASGARLSNTALAKEIGISRTPVREAISQLASGGLVEQVPGVGAFVKIPDDAEIAELAEVREYLELFAVHKIVDRITPGSLATLEELCAQGEQLLEDVKRNDGVATPAQRERMIELDLAFHSALVEAAGNRWIQRILDEFQVICRVFSYRRRHPSNLDDVTRISHIFDDHRAILEAIRDHDVERATSLLKQHIAMFRPVDVNHGHNHGRAHRPGAQLTTEQLAFLRQRSNQ